MFDIERINSKRTALVIVDIEEQFIRKREKYIRLARSIGIVADKLRPWITPLWVVKIPANGDSNLPKKEYLERLRTAQPHADDLFMAKRSYSVFAHTSLANNLNAKGVTQVMFCGIYSNDCLFHSLVDCKGHFKTAVIGDLTDQNFTNHQIPALAHVTYLDSEDVTAEFEERKPLRKPIINVPARYNKHHCADLRL